MKRTLALLLTSLMLTFPMTACGAGSTNGTTTGTTSGTTTGTTTTQSAYRTTKNNNNGWGVLTTNKGTTTANKTTTNNGVITNRTITSRTPTTTNRTIGTRTVNTTNQPSVVRGATYEQMLRNARVHDTNGFLRDGENAVTPGTLY